MRGSPSNILLSDEADRTASQLAFSSECYQGYSLSGSSFGANSAQLTVPLCPGNLYSSFPESLDQITTVPSPAPAATFLPLLSQLARIRFFSMPACAPSKVLIWRSVGANGRISQPPARSSGIGRFVGLLNGDSRGASCPSGQNPHPRLLSASLTHLSPGELVRQR